MAKRLKIAVVEDEILLADILKLILEDAFKCTVDIFEGAGHALEALKNYEYDLISCDYSMPGLSGLDLVRTLRTQPGPNSRTKVLFLSGNGFGLKADIQNELIGALFLAKPATVNNYLKSAKILLNSEFEEVSIKDSLETLKASTEIL